MSEELIFTFVKYNFLIIFFFLALKIFLFITMKTKRKTFKNFLYFTEANVRGTKDPKRKTQKVVQNVLSVILLMLLLMQVFVFLSGAFFKRKIEE